MSHKSSEASAGDLIRAEDWNDVVGDIAALDERLTKLEDATAGGRLLVTGLFPTPPVMEGTEVALLGANFGPRQENHVRIDSGSALFLKGTSDDSSLVFTVPVFGDTPEEGRPARLTVENPRGKAALAFVVVPREQALQGAVTVLVGLPDVAQVDPGNTYEFPCALIANISTQETFTLSASIEDVATEWPDVELSVDKITFAAASAPGITRTLVAKVRVPRGATGTARLLLTVTGKRFTAFQRAGSRRFPIGTPLPSAGGLPVDIQGAKYKVDGVDTTLKLPSDPEKTIVLPRDTVVTMTIVAKVGENTGTYQITSALEGDPKRKWALSIPVSQIPYPEVTPAKEIVFEVRMRGPSDAPRVSLRIEVVKKGDEKVFGALERRSIEVG
jgi:hypothetical protein